MDQWLEDRIVEVLNMPPIELGELLYNQRGCSQCHSIDGSKRVGPSFNQTYGISHEFNGGATQVGDDNYIRESVENPQALVRAGFPPSMPTYKGLLREVEIRGLIAFIKSRNPKFKAEAKRESANPPKAPENGEKPAEAPAPEKPEKPRIEC